MAQYANQLSLYRKLKSFKGFNLNVLHRTGKASVEYLWSNYLRGQKLRYRSQYDKRGRRTISYGILRKKDLVIKSYPLHLWERGFARKKTSEFQSKTSFQRKGRARTVSKHKVSGKKIAGRYVLKALATEMESRLLERYAGKALEKQLEALFKQ